MRGSDRTPGANDLRDSLRGHSGTLAQVTVLYFVAYKEKCFALPLAIRTISNLELFVARFSLPMIDFNDRVADFNCCHI